MLLVSACLAGTNCKYSGGNNFRPEIKKLVQEGKAIPVCPEQLGGLPTPRLPSEIRAGSGTDVISGKAEVVTSDNNKVTDNFLRGARETLNIARMVKAKGAILKEGSPSCGSSRIADGTFSGTYINGEGVTAALLRKEGIPVVNEDCWQELLPPMNRSAPYLAVIGASSCSEAISSIAEETGREIARQGAVMICGGRGGVMTAAARGAHSQNGVVIGILPGNNRHEGNPWLSVSIATGLGDARNAVIARASDALIAIDGRYGTLSEIGLGLKMGKPVIGLNTWEISKNKANAEILQAESPAEAVALALEQIQKIKNNNN